MKIKKAKDGRWQVRRGNIFKVEEFEPNLRKTAKLFTELNFSEFFNRLKKYFGIRPDEAPSSIIKVRVLKSGGCWNVRTLDDKLIMIHDFEYQEDEREPEFRKPKKRKKRWKEK